MLMARMCETQRRSSEGTTLQHDLLEMVGAICGGECEDK